MCGEVVIYSKREGTGFIEHSTSYQQFSGDDFTCFHNNFMKQYSQFLYIMKIRLRNILLDRTELVIYRMRM